MNTSKSCKSVIAMCAIVPLVLSSCMQQQPLGVEIDSTSSMPSAPLSNDMQPPPAPEIAEGGMEDFSVDQNVAKKLSESPEWVADSWYMEQLHKGKIELDESVSLVVRDRICSEISSGSNIHMLTGDTLSSYDLTGKQQGIIIAASMLSHCPQEKLLVPQGSFKK